MGDVEIATAIIVPTPELDRLRAVTTESQACGAFLDWLVTEKRYELCELDEYDRLVPVRYAIQSLLAEYFGIDEAKCERERVALLEALRR